MSIFFSTSGANAMKLIEEKERGKRNRGIEGTREKGKEREREKERERKTE